MQHEILAIFAFQRIDDLFILSGAKCGDNQGLGFTAGEKG